MYVVRFCEWPDALNLLIIFPMVEQEIATPSFLSCTEISLLLHAGYDSLSTLILLTTRRGAIGSFSFFGLRFFFIISKG